MKNNHSTPTKENAPAPTEASFTTMAGSHNEQTDYTPSDALKAIEVLRKTLPQEISDRMIRAYQNGLQERLSGNATAEDVALEALLPGLSVIPARQILAKTFPEVENLIPTYMTPGIWFVYGKPKIGKSWLVSQIALAVSSKGVVFDKPVRPGKVLYLALEDGEKRLKKRMLKQNWPYNVDIDYMTPKTFREEIGYLNLSGGKRLLAFIERNNYLLTIIDTFSRAINSNQLKGELMTEALSPYQEFCQAKDRYMIFVDHEPKRNETDTTAITGLFGGIAKAGMADGVWRLYKERGKGVKLDIEGRDTEDNFSLKLRFDKTLCHWFSEGDADAIEITERRKEILDALENLGRCSTAQLEDATGQPKGHLHTRLQDLVTEGLVSREKRGNNIYYEINK